MLLAQRGVMLTDYHTHLRPDDPGHRRRALLHRGATWRDTWSGAERGAIGELGFSEHVYRFREALDVWRHPFWEEHAQSIGSSSTSHSWSRCAREAIR